jgi:hypothetical protein
VANEYPNYAFDVKALVAIDEALESTDEQRIKDVFEEVSEEISIIKHFEEMKKEGSFKESRRGRRVKRTS